MIEADLATFFEQQRDPAAIRMAAVAARDEPAFRAHWARILCDDAIRKSTILSDGRVAGYVVSFERLARMEVGYWIGSQYWGQGIATRALSQFLEQVTARPLYARVVKDNIASIRVLENCGFVISGEEKVFLEARGEEVEGFILKLGPQA